MIKKSGRMRGIRHVAQIEGTNNPHQAVPGIPDGKGKCRRTANRWENIILVILNKMNVKGEMN
jgi:hypothetical protein